jgi:hypothetical protein
VPVLVAQLAGTVPARLKKRIYWSLPRAGSPEFATEIGDLARAIRTRVELRRKLNMLTPDSPPDQTQSAAQEIALEGDRTLVAEDVSLLAQRYLDLGDPTTRFWIAMALGSAGTRKAARLLERLPPQDHPYALEGIRQAKEMIARGR